MYVRSRAKNVIQILFVLNKDEFCLIVFGHKMDQAPVWRPVLTLAPPIEQTETKQSTYKFIYQAVKVKTMGALDYHPAHLIL